jgi:hypothetical protein
MRTTLIIEERIASDLKRIAQTSGKQFEVVVNETLQVGLTTREERRERQPYLLRPTSLGDVRTGIDLDKSLAVADALADEDLQLEADPGHGDYTKERQGIFADLELEDLLTAIKDKKGSAENR